MDDLPIRIDPDVGPEPVGATTDPVAVALRAQFEAWRLRDALSLADWLRYQSGYTAGIAERALHGKAGG